MSSTVVWTRSEDLRAEAQAIIPGGVNSNVRLQAPRVFFARGRGPRMWDVDGNDYVDYVLGQGPNFLGHAPKGVNQRVARAVKRGSLFAGQHSEEITAAHAVLDAVGWADMLRFAMTGTEAVQAALRAARAATGRRRFIRFEGQYHGWLDNVLVSVGDRGAAIASKGQLESHLSDSAMVPWNDLAAVEALLRQHPDDFAALITEPVMVNSGSIQPAPGYLEGLRELCSTYGVVLIFDEVITGFRLARAGAVGAYGVVPDLATYGKAMAGGWPVAAVAGRRELMEPFGTGEVNQSGTFNGSAMATSAVLATLEELNDGAYARVEQYGTELAGEIRRLGETFGVALRVQGPASALHVGIGPATPVLNYRELQQLDLNGFVRLSAALARHGVWSTNRGTWYVSTTHGPDEMSDTVTRFTAALEEFTQ